MTPEKLNRAEELYEKIKSINTVIEIFRAGDGMSTTHGSMIFFKEDIEELKEQLKKKKVALEKEFAEL